MFKKVIFICVISLFFSIDIDLKIQIAPGAVLAQHSERFQVLLFTKSVSYPNRHDSISDGVEMFKDLSAKHRFGLTWTADSEIFNDHERLNSMDVVVFMNTSGDILDVNQKEAFQDYIRNGGNFVGIHGASYTMMDWPWYIELLGAVWNGHPGRHTAALNVEHSDHPSTVHLPSTWSVTDEWYNFLEISDKINVVLTVDEDSYPGGEMSDYHPIAWYQDGFEGARSYYTLLGHTEEAYDDPLFRQHIYGAVWWAAIGYEMK